MTMQPRSDAGVLTDGVIRWRAQPDPAGYAAWESSTDDGQTWEPVRGVAVRYVLNSWAADRARLLATPTPDSGGDSGEESCERYSRTCAGWRTADGLSADLTYAGEARDAWRDYAEHAESCVECAQTSWENCHECVQLRTAAAQADKLIDPGHGAESGRLRQAREATPAPAVSAPAGDPSAATADLWRERFEAMKRARDEERAMRHAMLRERVWPESGEVRHCFVCSRDRAWGLIDTTTGAVICKVCLGGASAASSEHERQQALARAAESGAAKETEVNRD